MNKKYAAIDIGTNTLLMLIAEQSADGEMKVVIDEQYIARLGEGVDSTKIINDDAILRASEILKKYRQIIKEYKVDEIRIVGTSCLRDAKNSEYVISRLQEVIGCNIEIIPGIVEAELSFLGAIEDNEPSIVIDIGGGSTEIIYGREEQLIERNSLDVGAVRITERIFKDHPPKIESIEKAKKFLIEELKTNINKKYSGKYYAVAGTPTTVAAVAKNLKVYDDKEVNGYELSLREMEDVFNRFINMSVEDIINKLHIHPKRADVITAGTLILITIMKYFNISSVTVSSHGLRYGVMKSLLAR